MVSCKIHISKIGKLFLHKLISHIYYLSIYERDIRGTKEICLLWVLSINKILTKEMQ